MSTVALHRRLLLVALLALLGSTFAACGGGEQTKPNVVLIIIDTLRADFLGSHGFPEDISPELDRIAREGVRFDRAIAQCSWTRPSIGSMVTGMYPRQLRLYDEQNERLDETALTLAEALKTRGYTTLGATANPNINGVFGFAQGFDRYLDSDQVFDWMLRDQSQSVVQPGSLMPAPEILDALLSMIRTQGQAPYYLQANLMEMHEYGAPVRPEFRGLYLQEKRPYVRDYMQSLTQLSQDIVSFMEELVKKPGMEDTLFILTSDHGEGLYDHPEVKMAKYHGYVLYESNVHVPLIFHSSSGALQPGVVEQPVRVMDIVPTVLDFLGIPVPTSIQGTSLRPLLEEPQKDIGLPERFVLETRFRKVDKMAVYSARHEYIQNRDNWPGLPPHELQTIGVKANGAATDVLNANPALAAELRSYLETWEESNPALPPTLITDGVPEDLVEKLRSIGYLK